MTEASKTDERARFSSMLDGIRSKILLMVVDAEILDLVTVDGDLENSTGEKKDTGNKATLKSSLS
ncbi:MAG: hypothetical protein ACFFD4_15235 [Candidatus Odinarchaeota archaeon]